MEALELDWTINPQQAYALVLILFLLNTSCPVLANSVDPDHLAPKEANWSGSALFVFMNLYQKSV